MLDLWPWSSILVAMGLAFLLSHGCYARYRNVALRDDLMGVPNRMLRDDLMGVPNRCNLMGVPNRCIPNRCNLMGVLNRMLNRMMDVPNWRHGLMDVPNWRPKLAVARVLGLSLWSSVLALMSLAFVLSQGCYALYRYVALRHGLMDVPNWRSAHVESVPTGAGIIILLVALPLLALLVAPASPLYLALSGFGVLVAVLGFVDDHYPLPASVRLVSQFVSAAGVIVCLQVTGLALNQDGSWFLSGMGLLVPFLGVVWVMNVHNFMDGLDGFASIQSLCFLLPAAVLFVHLGEVDLALVALMVATPVFAFLFWNLPLGRLFLGDAGATSLGFVIAVLMLLGWQISWGVFISLLVLYGVFLTDASCTLVWRLLRGENCFTAHRSHLFQQLARRHGTPWVLKALSLINLLGLLPLAGLITAGQVQPLAGLLLAYVPLIIGYLAYHHAEDAPRAKNP